MTTIGFCLGGNTAFYGPLIQLQDDIYYSSINKDDVVAAVDSRFPDPYYAFYSRNALEGSAKLDLNYPKYTLSWTAYLHQPLFHFVGRSIYTGSVRKGGKGEENPSIFL